MAYLALILSIVYLQLAHIWRKISRHWKLFKEPARVWKAWKTYHTYENRLQNLKVIKIEERAKRGDLIEAYKIMTGKLKVDANHFFTKDTDSRTRGHHLKLVKPRSNGLLRSKFFSRRVIDTWNSLPDEVVSAQSTNLFIVKLDKCLQTMKQARN